MLDPNRPLWFPFNKCWTPADPYVSPLINAGPQQTLVVPLKINAGPQQTLALFKFTFNKCWTPTCLFDHKQATLKTNMKNKQLQNPTLLNKKQMLERINEILTVKFWEPSRPMIVFDTQKFEIVWTAFLDPKKMKKATNKWQ